jgi:hypothetical protein
VYSRKGNTVDITMALLSTEADYNRLINNLKSLAQNTSSEKMSRLGYRLGYAVVRLGSGGRGLTINTTVSLSSPVIARPEPKSPHRIISRSGIHAIGGVVGGLISVLVLMAAVYLYKRKQQATGRIRMQRIANVSEELYYQGISTSDHASRDRMTSQAHVDGTAALGRFVFAQPITQPVHVQEWQPVVPIHPAISSASEL